MPNSVQKNIPEYFCKLKYKKQKCNYLNMYTIEQKWVHVLQNNVQTIFHNTFIFYKSKMCVKNRKFYIYSKGQKWVHVHMYVYITRDAK